MKPPRRRSPEARRKIAERDRAEYLNNKQDPAWVEMMRARSRLYDLQISMENCRARMEKLIDTITAAHRDLVKKRRRWQLKKNKRES